jgi:hypothetical protein
VWKTKRILLSTLFISSAKLTMEIINKPIVMKINVFWLNIKNRIQAIGKIIPPPRMVDFLCDDLRFGLSLILKRSAKWKW